MWRHAAVFILFVGCFSRYPKPATPRPMTTPIAIPNINSKYDDFNSIDMSFFRLHSLVFSTNRGSEGHDYDLYSSTLVWDWTEQNVSPTPMSAREPVPYAPALMSSGNERGPNLIVHDNEYSLVFASDR